MNQMKFEQIKCKNIIYHMSSIFDGNVVNINKRKSIYNMFSTPSCHIENILNISIWEKTYPWNWMKRLITGTLTIIIIFIYMLKLIA